MAEPAKIRRFGVLGLSPRKAASPPQGPRSEPLFELVGHGIHLVLFLAFFPIEHQLVDSLPHLTRNVRWLENDSPSYGHRSPNHPPGAHLPVPTG